MRASKPSALLLVASSASLGCGADSGEGQDFGEQSIAQPIVRGEPSPAGTPEDAIVLIRTTTQTEHICSGTLVAPNLVLTARHCIAYTGPPKFECTIEGELTQNPEGGGVLGAHFAPEDIEVYDARTPRTEIIARGAAIHSTLSNSACTNDMAFVVLDRKLELPSLPIRVGLPTRRGELVTIVGYGSDGSVTDFEWPDRPRRRLANQRVAGVGPDSTAEGVTTVRPRTLTLIGPAGCFGDSGGPAVSETSGAVIGVYSILRGRCDAETVEHSYTHTAPFESLARNALEAAGAEPMFEDDRVLGEACMFGHECQSGQCIENAEARICSEACEADQCQSGFVCTASSNGSWCVPPVVSACADCGDQDSGGCAFGRGGGHSSGFFAALIAAVGLARKRRRTIGRRRRLPVAGLLLAGVLLVAACGDDEPVLDEVARGGGAGASGSRATGGQAGLGGSGGTAGSGASGGTLGAAGSGGNAQDATAGSAGGAGDASSDSGTSCKPARSTYKLSICTRVGQQAAIDAHALMVTGYLGALRNDCRVALLTSSGVAQFVTRVETWSLGLIGCVQPAVSDFALSNGRTPLTAADVAVLIEIYMRIATLRLGLSPGEVAELKHAVECLGRGAVTDPSTTTHAQSNCGDGGPDGAAGSDARGPDGSGGAAGGDDGSSASAGAAGDDGSSASAGAAGESDASVE